MGEFGPVVAACSLRLEGIRYWFDEYGEVPRIWMWLHQEEPLEASSGTCRSVLDRPKFWRGAHRSIFAAVGPQQCRSGSLRTGYGDHPGSHGG